MVKGVCSNYAAISASFSPPFDRRADEAGEERLGRGRLAFELGMELHGYKPGVLGQLDDLDQRPVLARAGELHAVRRELLPIDIVELVAVPVALADRLVAV